MRLGQIRWNNQVMAAIFDAAGARPIPDHTLYDLLLRSEVEKIPLEDLARQQASKTHVDTPPIIPIHPREVWACGCTYREPDDPHPSKDVHERVREATRPEIFFKGTSRVCIGLNRNIGIRQDSRFTIPEPELAVLLGKGGQILGYTLANDLSAKDLEFENPLYMPQSKIYSNCCALGPLFVTPSELTDPYNLEMTCTITRGDQVTFTAKTHTAHLLKKIDTLIEYLTRSNPVPTGSVLLTGTGIHVTEEAALQAGDVVSISVPEIGELRNPAAIV